MPVTADHGTGVLYEDAPPLRAMRCLRTGWWKHLADHEVEDGNLGMLYQPPLRRQQAARNQRRPVPCRGIRAPG